MTAVYCRPLKSVPTLQKLEHMWICVSNIAFNGLLFNGKTRNFVVWFEIRWAADLIRFAHQQVVN